MRVEGSRKFEKKSSDNPSCALLDKFRLYFFCNYWLFLYCRYMIKEILKIKTENSQKKKHLKIFFQKDVQSYRSLTS